MDLTIENSCRVCMQSTQTLVGIFEEHDGRPISDLISEITGVNIEISDLLSKKICSECESKTLEFHAFKQLCIDSDETVRYNLLLADESESNDHLDVISDETLKKVVDENSQVEEYFIEDDGVEQEDETTEYEEHFVKDSDALDDHIFATVETSDEDSFDMEKKNIVVIERVDTRMSAANSIVYEPGEDLTEKMRYAHFAKEQQKKHKCPHCDKFFMFPSKGKAANLIPT